MDFSLPEFGASSEPAWNDSSNYSLDNSTSGSHSMKADSWWVDSSSVDANMGKVETSNTSSLWSGVWDWANTESGTSVIGGALQGGLSVWGSELRNDAYVDASKRSSQYSRDQSARMDQHNKSINKPLKLDIRKFKKP